MKSLDRQRGSTAIETLVSIVALVTLLSGGLTVVYSSFAHVWLERVAYETLICLSTRTTVFECETRMRERTNQSLPVGRIENLHLDRTERQAQIAFRFTVSERVIVNHRQTLHLPLVGRVLR